MVNELKVLILKSSVLKMKKHICKFGVYETSGAFFGKVENNQITITDIYYSNEKGTMAYVYTPYSKRMKRFAKFFYQKTNYDYVNYNYIGDWHTHPSFECIPSSNDVRESRLDIKKLELNFIVSTILKVLNDELIIKSYYIDMSKVVEIPVFIIV